MLYSEERYLLKEGREEEREKGRRTSFPSLYNLTRQLKLAGNLHKSYTDHKSYTESRTILKKLMKYRLKFKNGNEQKIYLQSFTEPRASRMKCSSVRKCMIFQAY